MHVTFSFVQPLFTLMDWICFSKAIQMFGFVVLHYQPEVSDLKMKEHISNVMEHAVDSIIQDFGIHFNC